MFSCTKKYSSSAELDSRTVADSGDEPLKSKSGLAQLLEQSIPKAGVSVSLQCLSVYSLVTPSSKQSPTDFRADDFPQTLEIACTRSMASLRERRETGLI
jgi:hypothetical protein